MANKIISELDVPWVTLLSMDSFYKVLNERQHEAAAVNEVRTERESGSWRINHYDAFSV